jgi:myo-inositol 2-dehydrogenase/D-chiro-inositol 1-dehydrogenase
MAVSENPRAHTGSVLTAAGERRPPNPYFFLERYLPSYAREWEAFVEAVKTGATPPVSTNDARPPLVIGLAAGRSLREGRPVRVEEVQSP